MKKLLFALLVSLGFLATGAFAADVITAATVDIPLGDFGKIALGLLLAGGSIWAIGKGLKKMGV